VADNSKTAIASPPARFRNIEDILPGQYIARPASTTPRLGIVIGCVHHKTLRRIKSPAKVWPLNVDASG